LIKALVRSKVKEGIDPKKMEYNHLVSSYKEELAKIETSKFLKEILTHDWIVDSQFVKLKNKSSSYRSTMSLLRKFQQFFLFIYFNRRDTVRKKYWALGDAEKAAIDQENRIFSNMTMLALEDKNTSILRY